MENTDYTANIKERDYWLGKLSGELVKSTFPHDHYNHPKTGTSKQGEKQITFKFPPDLFSRLMEVTNGCDYTLQMVLVAALGLLLRKYGNREDILIGTSIYQQDMEGDFVNTALTLRNNLSDDLTFKQLLLQVKQTMMEAVENQNYSIETLLYQLELPFSETDFPLFDVALLLENIQNREYLEFIPVNMTFSFSRDESDIKGIIRYNPSLYRKTTIERIITHFINSLAQALANANARILEIEVLSPQEKDQLLYDFNDTTLEYPQDKQLQQLFAQQVRKTPGVTAVVFHSHHITYDWLNERANRLAAGLIFSGLKPGEPAPIKGDTRIETLVGIIAVLKAGGAFLPIAPDCPPDRVEYMLNDSGATLLLFATPFREALHFDGTPINLLNPSAYRDSGSGKDDNSPPGPIRQSHDPCYIIYTSGSTGDPKGVMIEHKNIVNQIHGLKEMLFTGIRLNHILLAPFTFDPSVQHMFSPLTYGGKLFMVVDEIKIDVSQLMEFMVEKRIDIIDAVPSQMSLMVEFAGKYNKLNLKYIILAGEVFTYDLYMRIENAFNVEKVINIYGPTEATINSTYFECKRDDRRTFLPIGKPLMNYKIRIMDHQLNLLPIGVPGEMFIAGEGIARGYFNQPQLTHEKFIKNPHIPGERMYASGDRGRWLPDGNIEFIGRFDQQVKIRGARIEPEEIERTLRGHKTVKEAVLTISTDENAEKYLCAYIVPRGEFEISSIREYLANKLPNYMIPSYFVQIPEIPLTAHGKVDKRQLPNPDTAGRVEYTAPTTETEKIIAQSWKEVLNLETVGGYNVSISHHCFPGGIFTPGRTGRSRR
jgi:amino acid adenylation domain-containing protein